MNSLSKQSGMVLIFSMILLFSLTLLAVSSARTSSIELSMAGNLRESDIAFNAAEIGLIEAEEFIRTSSVSVFNDPDNGLLGQAHAEPDYFNAATWENARTATTAIPNVYGQPRLIIKYLGERSDDAGSSVTIGSYGSAQSGTTVSYFRITSAGSGQGPLSKRYLQTHFGYTY